MKLLVYFFRIIDFFIHPNTRTDKEIYQRAQILSGYLIFLIAVCVIASLILWLFVESALLVMHPLLPSCLTVLFCINLYGFRRYGNLELFTNIALFLIYFIIASVICITDGPSESYLTLLLVLPPIMAHLMIEKKWGTRWIAICGITLVLLFALEFSGMNFPMLLAADMEAGARVLATLLGYVTIVFMVRIYYVISNRYRSERDVEHNKVLYLATHDPLTHVANRLKFDTEIV